MKKKFDSNLFYSVLSKKNFKGLIKSKLIDREYAGDMFFAYAVAKGLGHNNNNQDWIYFLDEHKISQPIFSPEPKNAFKFLDKKFEYTSLIQIHDNEPNGEWDSSTEIGFFTHKNHKELYLIFTSYYRMDYTDPFILFISKDKKKNDFPKIQKTILNYLKSNKNLGILLNIVNFNKNFKWKYNEFIKIFSKIGKIRDKEMLKGFKKHNLEHNYPDWYRSLYLFKTENKLMTSKTPFLPFRKAFKMVSFIKS